MSQIASRKYILKTGDKLIIRTAVCDDAQALLRHARIILAKDRYNVTTFDEFDTTVRMEREWITKHIEQPGQIVLVAELDGSIVGLLGFENSPRKRLAHSGTLHMSVRPQFRRKGVGTALLDALIDWARKNPLIEKVKLAVFATNQPALSMYRKMGFIEEGRRTREIKLAKNRYVDEILMCRFAKD